MLNPSLVISLMISASFDVYVTFLPPFFRGALWHIAPRVFVVMAGNIRQTTQLIKRHLLRALSALFEKKAVILINLRRCSSAQKGEVGHDGT
jgi:hypothetical protein